MEANEVQKAIEDLEPQVERLKALYEQYFMGIEKLPPAVLQKSIERVIWELRRVRFQSSRQRFKFQQIIQRYNTYGQHWARILRQIEHGTYKRDIIRAAKRVGTDAVIAATGHGVIDREVERALAADGGASDSRSWAIDDERTTGADDCPTPPGLQSAPASWSAPSGIVTPRIAARQDAAAQGREPQSPTSSPATGGWSSASQSAASALRWASLGSEAARATTASRNSSNAAAGGAATGGSALPAFAHHPGPTQAQLQASGSAAAPAPGNRLATLRGHGSPEFPPLRSQPEPSHPAPRAGWSPQALAQGTRARSSPDLALANASEGRPHFDTLQGTRPPAAALQAQTGQSIVGEATPMAKPQYSTMRGSPPSPRPSAGSGAGAPDEDARARQLYTDYVAAKRRVGEPTQGLSFEKVAQSLREQGDKLKIQHPNRRLDFEVVMQDGRALIRPVLR